MNLNAIARKLFDKETQALVEAGVLDESLQVTPYVGRDVIDSFIVQNFKKELAIEASLMIEAKKEARKNK